MSGVFKTSYFHYLIKIRDINKVYKELLCTHLNKIQAKQNPYSDEKTTGVIFFRTCRLRGTI